jgi:hypothetical protein
MKNIEFYSVIPGLVDAVPIYEAKQHSTKWMSAVKDDYIAQAKNSKVRANHIFQCPGIFDLFSYGYIIPAWHDVLIKTNGDPSGFAWLPPTDDFTAMTSGFDAIGKHKDGIDQYLPKKPGALHSVIKFNTPWRVVAPKGIKFLVLPVAYPDSYEFESTIGVLDPGINSQINIQTYWNIRNGEHVIKAGTPMAHLIPISEQKFNFVCREMTKWDELWVRKDDFFRNFTFKIKRSVLKEAYNKHYTEE